MLQVFGCFASSGWKLERGYYGTGETFSFKATPEVQVFPWIPNSNNFFMQAEENGLGVGGG